MNILTIVTIGFLVLEATNVVAFIFSLAQNMRIALEFSKLGINRRPTQKSIIS
jgi:hypothetical protein